jgi:hypothetical protein
MTNRIHKPCWGHQKLQPMTFIIRMFTRVSDTVENKHSESIASNTKSPTGGICNQNRSSRTKLNFDF